MGVGKGYLQDQKQKKKIVPHLLLILSLWSFFIKWVKSEIVKNFGQFCLTFLRHYK